MTGFFSSIEKEADKIDVKLASDIKKAKEKTAAPVKENNWKAFGIGIFSSLIYALLLGFVASNFVYLTDPAKLDKLFPTDCDKPPYDGSYATKHTAIDYFSPTKFTAPYNQGPADGMEGIGYGIKNWFITTMIFSYRNGRRVIKGLLQLMGDLQTTFSGKPNAGPQGGSLIPFLSSFFLVPMFIYSSMFGGFFLTMLGQFYNGDDVFWRFLWGLFFMFFFGIGPMIAGAVSFTQFIQTLVTFTLLPFFQDRGRLFEIVRNNKKYIIALFGFLVLMDAGNTLQKLPQWPMWLVYLVLILLPTLFGKAKRAFGKNA